MKHAVKIVNPGRSFYCLLYAGITIILYPCVPKVPLLKSPLVFSLTLLGNGFYSDAEKVFLLQRILKFFLYSVSLGLKYECGEYNHDYSCVLLHN